MSNRCPECKERVCGWLNYPGAAWCPSCGWRGPRPGWEECRECLNGKRWGVNRATCPYCIEGYVKKGMRLDRSPRWKRVPATIATERS